ncbi:unnamed protein product [Xylocopa violacea]|uniref:NADH dehydrogenase [ubiquinone] flavoprotein 3, mitochondrial n=1 Tax=Xylocopa violacea TaxID=135666 RepID=A0ABP1NIM5_XYLVO
MLHSILGKLVKPRQNLILLRFASTKKSTRGVSNATAANPNVTGLSNKCLKVPNTPVGPGAAKNKEYKNPEYFCYHIDTFGEAEVELAKYRLPAPSNKVPFQK